MSDFKKSLCFVKMFFLEKSEQICVLRVEFCLIVEQSTGKKKNKKPNKTSGYCH